MWVNEFWDDSVFWLNWFWLEGFGMRNAFGETVIWMKQFWMKLYSTGAVLGVHHGLVHHGGGQNLAKVEGQERRGPKVVEPEELAWEGGRRRGGAQHSAFCVSVSRLTFRRVSPSLGVFSWNLWCREEAIQGKGGPGREAAARRSRDGAAGRSGFTVKVFKFQAFSFGGVWG